jgi:hypothetical protein
LKKYSISEILIYWDLGGRAEIYAEELRGDHCVEIACISYRIIYRDGGLKSENSKQIFVEFYFENYVE